MTLQPLQRRSLVAEAYEQIREAITVGELAPGSPLVETHLADQLGISRPPLREALARLRAEGLVVGARRGGVAVAGLDPSELVEAYNLRTAVEVASGRLAALTGADTRPLHAAIDALRRAGQHENLADVLDADVAFHRTLCESSGSQVLVRAFDSVAGRVRMALSIDDASYETLALVADEHVPIVEAVERRDESEIASVVARHIFDGAKTTFGRLGGDDRLLLRPPRSIEL
jgi:DNA-binding GntR family transcriptional regulator